MITARARRERYELLGGLAPRPHAPALFTPCAAHAGVTARSRVPSEVQRNVAAGRGQRRRQPAQSSWVRGFCTCLPSNRRAGQATATLGALSPCPSNGTPRSVLQLMPQ
jgi:hypothetical protein